MENQKINMVFFHSEGENKDKGLNLTREKDEMYDIAKDLVNNISVYTPSLLKNLGYGEYVKEYENTGVVSQNPGLQYIGFCAWRPLIMLLELEKMNEGDIVIYRDVNCTRYPQYKDMHNIANIARDLLDNYARFDFFSPREWHLNMEHDNAYNENRITTIDGYLSTDRKPVTTEQYCKTNVIRELGENHPFSYNFPTCCSNFLIFRKSAISLEFLKEWLEGCKNERWINGEVYGDMSPDFQWHCPEQGILCVLIANWIRKKKHNIPCSFPNAVFINRNINEYIYPIIFNHLRYLHI
jgi:hypothetical protein